MISAVKQGLKNFPAQFSFHFKTKYEDKGNKTFIKVWKGSTLDMPDMGWSGSGMVWFLHLTIYDNVSHSDVMEGSSPESGCQVLNPVYNPVSKISFRLINIS